PGERPFHCQPANGFVFRRWSPPGGRPGSSDGPRAARDNETFDHLLSLLKQWVGDGDGPGCVKGGDDYQYRPVSRHCCDRRMALIRPVLSEASAASASYCCRHSPARGEAAAAGAALAGAGPRSRRISGEVASWAAV